VKSRPGSPMKGDDWPYRAEVIERIKLAREIRPTGLAGHRRGRIDRHGIADHLGLFDRVLHSTIPKISLPAQTRPVGIDCVAMVDFDYAGNSRDDLAVFRRGSPRHHRGARPRQPAEKMGQQQ
jgi:hypothetical protein